MNPYYRNSETWSQIEINTIGEFLFWLLAHILEKMCHTPRSLFMEICLLKDDQTSSYVKRHSMSGILLFNLKYQGFNH